MGVLKTWLSERYLPFWQPFLNELEVELVAPQPEAINLPFPAPVRQLVSEVFSLKNQGVDYVLLPDMQLGAESQKGNASPWLADLHASLQRVIPGLPPALVVPAELSPTILGLAAEIGQTLTRNPMLSRRALERSKKALSQAYKPQPQSGQNLVGLVAQPVLLEPHTLHSLSQGLAAHGLSLFTADKSPADLREEGQKLELGLELPTDLESAGMHRYLNRLGKVRALIYLHDPQYAPLPTPLRKLLKRNETKPHRLLGLEAHWAEEGAALAAALS